VDASALPTNMSPYTLEAEVKTTASTNQGIISWGNFGTANRVNAFRTQGGSSLVNYWWANDLTKSTGGVNLADGAWHHVMAAFDGTTRSLHVDSSEIGSDTPTTSLAVTKTDNFCVGSSNNGEYFKGQIRNIKVWDVFHTQRPTGCAWTTHTGNYSGGYAGGVSTSFNLQSGKAKCLELGAGVCKGVTCSGATTCTVRGSSSLGNSPSGETTYVPSSACYAQGPLPQHITDGATSCTACPEDHFSSAIGVASIEGCQPCPQWWTYSPAGATSEAQCKVGAGWVVLLVAVAVAVVLLLTKIYFQVRAARILRVLRDLQAIKTGLLETLQGRAMLANETPEQLPELRKACARWDASIAALDCGLLNTLLNDRYYLHRLVRWKWDESLHWDVDEVRGWSTPTEWGSRAVEAARLIVQTWESDDAIWVQLSDPTSGEEKRIRVLPAVAMSALRLQVHSAHNWFGCTVAELEGGYARLGVNFGGMPIGDVSTLEECGIAEEAVLAVVEREPLNVWDSLPPEEEEEALPPAYAQKEEAAPAVESLEVGVELGPMPSPELRDHGEFEPEVAEIADSDSRAFADEGDLEGGEQALLLRSTSGNLTPADMVAVQENAPSPIFPHARLLRTRTARGRELLAQPSIDPQVYVELTAPVPGQARTASSEEMYLTKPA